MTAELAHESLPPGFRWPDGIRAAAFFSFDMDAEAAMLADHPEVADYLDVIAHQRYGPQVGVPRILRLLDRVGLRTTFFIPGRVAETWPDLARSVRDAGHEIGHHGFVHEPLSQLAPEREREILRLGLEALEQVAGVRPLGYRAPNVDVSVNTVDILLEHGFQYDASFSGSDFEPYYLRHGDRFPPDGAYEFGETVDLVGIPFSWGLSDFQYFEFVPGITVRQDTPSAVYEIWHGELEWAHAHVPGGVYDLTMHPQAIGRGHRLVMVERLIEAAKALDGVAFERLGDYAARWRAQHPLAEWLAGSPVHARGT
jgi:peptidoglycan/xylan/chitin deacetylase (PgdA/CDA1 family)